MIATIVVGVMIECFCLYTSIQTKSSHHSTTPTGQQSSLRKTEKNYRTHGLPTRWMGFLSISGVFLLRRLESCKDEMMWMNIFICELVHKEKDAGTASET